METAPELTRLIYQARQVNDGQPQFVVEKVKQALGVLKDRKIAALGLAYKPDVDDLRESPAKEVVHLLQKDGACGVRVWEPFRPNTKMNGLDMATSLDNAIQEFSVILLLVKHTAFTNLQPDEIVSKTSARILIDCVNGWNAHRWEDNGFAVHRLGVNHSKIVNHESQI